MLSIILTLSGTLCFASDLFLGGPKPEDFKKIRSRPEALPVSQRNRKIQKFTHPIGYLLLVFSILTQIFQIRL